MLSRLDDWAVVLVGIKCLEMNSTLPFITQRHPSVNLISGFNRTIINFLYMD